jgi:hypothetical protein
MVNREKIDALLAKLPPELRSQVISMKSKLQEQGGVVRRLNGGGRKPYRLRFREWMPDWSRRHRSIDLPDPDTAVTVDSIVRAWQAEYQREVDSLPPPRKIVDEKKVYRRVIGELATAHGASPHHRRKILLEYDEAAVSGVKELLRFTMLGGYGRPARPRGRPALGRWY